MVLRPGQDGLDYAFQREVGFSDAPVRIGIEYKPRQPRANLSVRNADTLLRLPASIDMPNVRM